MAAFHSNPELRLRAFIETARDLFPDPKPWLKNLRNVALVGNVTAVNEALANLQDWGAAAVSNEGSSTQWMREFPAGTIAELAQAALDVINADGDTPGSAPSSDVSHGYFGGRLVRLG